MVQTFPDFSKLNYSESQNKFDFHYNYFINIALHIRSLRSLRAYRLIVNEKIFFSFTIKSAGLRVVYKVVRQDDKMLIIVIGARADEEVYGIAQKRILDNNL